MGQRENKRIKSFEDLKNFIILRDGSLMDADEWASIPAPGTSKTEDAEFEVIEPKQLPFNFKNMFTPKETDRVFYFSPDSGHPTCLCSRCGNQIKEEETPIRMWPTKQGDIGFDPQAKAGTEFRYCQKCCEAEGIKFGEKIEIWEELEPDDPRSQEAFCCAGCGTARTETGPLSEDGYCKKCVTEMYDNGKTFNS